MGERRLCELGKWSSIFVSFVLFFISTTEGHYAPITYVTSGIAKGAVCLDGSPPAYNFDEGYGTGINNWLIQLEGGGWCNNVTSCLARKNTRLGSSKQMGNQLAFSGIMSNRHGFNPDFYNWNRVKIRYCDGSSFTGDVEAVNPETKLHYRGARVWLAVMEDLLAKGMRNAENAILSGCSAGGLASILHCDSFRALLPMGTKVKCLSDAGYFINVKDTAGVPHIEAYFNQVVSLHGSVKNLPASCTRSTSTPSSCFFPQNVIQQVRTPIFLLNAAYDSWQIRNILAPADADPHGSWNACKLDIHNCSPLELKTMQAFRMEFLNALPRSADSLARGVYIDSCYAHCQTEFQETWYMPDSPAIAQTVSEHGSKDDEHEASSANQTDESRVKVEGYGNAKVDQSEDMACASSESDRYEWSQASITNTASGIGSSSGRAVPNQSLTSPSSSFLSRFSFIPGNVSFRLSRATSLGSSRAYPVPSSNLRMQNGEEEICAVMPTSRIARTLTQCTGRSPARFRTNSQLYGSLQNVQAGRVIPLDQYSTRNESRNQVWVDGDLHSPRVLNDLDNIESRVFDRRTAAREPVERNVRFSRTLSVGRLRDRVLRRSSLSDMSFCPLQQDREVIDVGRGDRGQRLGGEARAVETELGVLPAYPQALSSEDLSSGMPNSLFGIQDHEVETSRSREARYHDLLEHRSNFLERRRQIRSQVRALQRLGSRFENLSVHERSCILSGQHRAGHCTCRVNNRDANVNDDTSARASISRIVMLAEALFEVLDEIHQQSVVLSSRRSVSSLGSVPAPNEVVASLPVKLYTKLQKHQNDEEAQCYICLVEYEEGECIRVLPCHHEFHRACIDKWLTEIHRVCPLCRGDICTRPDPLAAES